MRVLRDLRQRRVAPQVAEQAANRAFEGVDEVALIEQFLERKYRNKPLATLREDPKELASAYRRLRYAGFSSGNSIRVLKRYASEAEALESLESPEGEGSEA
jgi:regulatory protein